MPLHRLWSQRPFQLRGNAASGQKLGRASPQPTKRSLQSKHHPQTGIADSQGDREYTRSWILTQRHQTGKQPYRRDRRVLSGLPESTTTK